jgi:hypothetical protein
MYGTSVGSLEVIAYSSAGTQVLFSQSSDQGNRWYYQDVHIANLDNVKVSFGMCHTYGSKMTCIKNYLQLEIYN